MEGNVTMSKKGFLYILGATVIFSTMEIALKLVSGHFNPMQMTFTRFLVGGLFLIPFARGALKKRPGVHIARRDLAKFALLGTIGVLLSMTIYQIALLMAPASVVAVLFSSNPIFVVVFAFLILREPIRKHQVAALALDILGILILIDPLHTQLSPVGIALALISTLLFALYGVLGKKECQRFGGLTVTCGSFLFGGTEMFLFILLTKIPAVAQWFAGQGLDLFANIPLFGGYSWDVLPVVIYICLVNSGLGYACYFMAMEETSASETSLIFFFKPILAPILAFLILHEAITLNMLLGIACILAGSLVSLVPDLLKARRASLPQGKA